MFFLKPLDSNQNQEPNSTAASTWENAGEPTTCSMEAHILDLNTSTTTTVGDVLSVTQLVIRRGLALLVMVVILVAGVVLSDFLVKLLK